MSAAPTRSARLTLTAAVIGNVVSDYRCPSTLPGAGPSAAPVPISPALREQLGLELLSTQAPVDTIVIERIERPSEN